MKKLLFAGFLAFLLVFAGCASGGGAGGASGTATATGEGFFGDITVTVTLERGKITAVTADGPNETAGIGSRALMMLPDQMVRQNKADVDVLSGATMTSNGIIQGAKAAIAEISK